MTQSPASDVEEPPREVSDVLADRSSPLEDEESQPERDDSEPSGLETSRDSDRKTEVPEMDQRVPDEVEEETLEGRLSADTSEQIFIGQQIEAGASSGDQQPDETGFYEEQFTSIPGLDETEHGAVRTDLLDLSSTDRLQSPDKAPSGSSKAIFHIRLCPSRPI